MWVSMMEMSAARGAAAARKVLRCTLGIVVRAVQARDKGRVLMERAGTLSGEQLHRAVQHGRRTGQYGVSGAEWRAPGPIRPGRCALVVLSGLNRAFSD